MAGKRKRGVHLTKQAKQRKVEVPVEEEVPAPEDGIHSLKWAQAIVPQGGLLSLPIEVRDIICAYLVEETTIKPKKGRKGKFMNEEGEYLAIDTCTTLSRVCRQLFVDITGSGLLYSSNHFHFHAPFKMSQYITNIQPFYRNFRNITLRIPISHPWNSIVPALASALTALSALPSLRHLNIEFDVSRALCTAEGWQTNGKKYRFKDRLLESLGPEQANWAVLREKLCTFGVKFTVSPSIVGMRAYWLSFYTYYDTEDERLEQLDTKIKEVVLRK